MSKCKRTEEAFELEDISAGKVRYRAIDRITPDDIVLHFIDREALRLATGQDPGVVIPEEFIDFVIRDRYELEF